MIPTSFCTRWLSPEQKPTAAKLAVVSPYFSAMATGREQATTAEAIITEVAYVLRSRRHYDLTPDEIGARLRPLLILPGLRLTHKRTYLRAFELWEAHPLLDFEDLLSIAHLERLGLKEILSYDTDFDDIPTITRLEPSPKPVTEES